MTDSEALVKVESVSKKFCRSLKRSLWYGMQDMAAELVGGSRWHDRLRREEFWAVKDVAFDLRHGECLGLIGHNGAGKTTLLKMLNGLIKPDHGRIEMRGRVGALIALGAGFNPLLTGRENIYVNGSVLGLTKTEIDEKLDEIISFAEIGDFVDAPVQNYSSGMAVRLGFAVASACRPDVLLLDEVLAVGDMGFQAKCFNRLGEMRRRGTAFILVSHNMHQITRFCQNVLYLHRGAVAYFGPTDNGVELFHKEMATHALNTPTGDSTEKEEAGSMGVVMDEVFFADSLGRRVTGIVSGDPVSLVMHYRCLREPVSNPVLEIGIRDDTGELLIHGSNRMSGASLGVLRGDGILTARFDAIPVNNQILAVSIALWDSSLRELLYWRRGVKLLVRGRPESSGRILLNCSWDHSEVEPPTQVPAAGPTQLVR